MALWRRVVSAELKLPPGVQSALDRLKRTIDESDPKEMSARKREADKIQRKIEKRWKPKKKRKKAPVGDEPSRDKFELHPAKVEQMEQSGWY